MMDTFRNLSGPRQAGSNRKHFFRHCLPIILAAFISAPAHDTLMTVDKPYDSGSLTLPVPLISTPDTVDFSNGLRIINGFFPFSPIPETQLLSGGLTFSDSLVSRIGYKYSSLIRRDSISNSLVQFSKTLYFLNGDPDTVWNDAVRFPDSLHSLDSVIYRSVTSADTLRCKYVFSYGPGLSPYNMFGTVPNFNAIIYLQCTNGVKMKLQIYGLSETLLYGNPTLSSYRLRWAVDSLGNGKFTVPTNVIRRYAARHQNRAASKSMSLEMLSNPKTAGKNYLVNGRAVRLIDSRMVPHVFKRLVY
jgi:hypothetical protein